MSTEPLLTFDYRYAVDTHIGRGAALSMAQLEREAEGVAPLVQHVCDEADNNTVGFWSLPFDESTARAIQTQIRELPNTWQHVLVLGIGGSSLGARTIYEALAGSKPQMQLHFPDNSDPWALQDLLTSLPPTNTCALVVSKSGGTVETAAQFLVIQEWFDTRLGKADAWHDRVIAITDPEQGSLRKLVNDKTLRAFNIPPNVGGRFSALSPAGMLPASLAGIDVLALLEGAKRMSTLCRRTKVMENPAALYALLHVTQHRLFGRSLHVMMPYADALRAFSSWFVQLWAESLGKRHDTQSRLVEQGPTPIAAVGATDQHAQLQLFVEGPRDKMVTFIRVAQTERDLAIPGQAGDHAYLGKHTLQEVLNAQHTGTALALARDGRPSVSLEIPAMTPQSLGALIFFFEAATAYAGAFYGINPFDQPGVEKAKKITSALLGKPGSDADPDAAHAFAPSAQRMDLA